MNIHLVRNSLNTTCFQSQKSHYARTRCTDRYGDSSLNCSNLQSISIWIRAHWLVGKDSYLCNRTKLQLFQKWLSMRLDYLSLSKVHWFLKKVSALSSLYENKVLFTKPFQASSIWHQLKDVVFINWKGAVSKMNEFYHLFIFLNQINLHILTYYFLVTWRT